MYLPFWEIEELVIKGVGEFLPIKKTHNHDVQNINYIIAFVYLELNRLENRHFTNQIKPNF